MHFWRLACCDVTEGSKIHCSSSQESALPAELLDDNWRSGSGLNTGSLNTIQII